MDACKPDKSVDVSREVFLIQTTKRVIMHLLHLHQSVNWNNPSHPTLRWLVTHAESPLPVILHWLGQVIMEEKRAEAERGAWLRLWHSNTRLEKAGEREIN